MTDKEMKLAMEAIDRVLKNKSLTDKLRVIEKLGKKWRKQNSIEINEEVAKTRIRLTGKRILDVDVIK